MGVVSCGMVRTISVPGDVEHCTKSGVGALQGRPPDTNRTRGYSMYSNNRIYSIRMGSYQARILDST